MRVVYSWGRGLTALVFPTILTLKKGQLKAELLPKNKEKLNSKHTTRSMTTALEDRYSLH